MDFKVEQVSETVNFMCAYVTDFDEIGKLYDHSDVWARVTYFRAKDYIRKEMKNEGYFM